MGGLKIYIAGPWDTHGDLSLKAEELKQAGHTITHEWYNKNHGLTSECDGLLDTLGVEKCQVFVAVMPLPDYAYMGTNTEIGMALALRKHVYVVMPPDTNEVKHKARRNVFLRPGSVCMLETWTQFLQAIGVCTKTGDKAPVRHPIHLVR